MSKNDQLLPRVIRLVNAPRYLGVDKNYFNLLIRPYLSAINLGKRRVGFDRLDLDRWVDHYKGVSERPFNPMEDKKWDENSKPVDSQNEDRSGISTKLSTEDEFAKVLEQTFTQKRKRT